MKKINKMQIDWLDVLVDVAHDPTTLSSGLILYLDTDFNIDKTQDSFRPKCIESENNHKLQIKSVNGKLKISGNFYKWLNGQNVEGCGSIKNLVTNVLLKFEEMELIHPTMSEYDRIRQGEFKIYQVHVKQDIVFNNKNLA